MDCYSLLPFGRSLTQNAPFPVPGLLFRDLGFVFWGVFVGSHSLVPLVITTIGIFDTDSIFVCVVSIELRHDSCHDSCYGDLECSGVYLQNWCFAGVLVVSMGRHDSFV